MAKNIIVGNDLKSYKKKYGKAYSKGKLISFSKKEVNALYGENNKNSNHILRKNKKYELIGDTYYERPSHKKAVVISAAMAVALAGGLTAGHFIATNPNVGTPAITSDIGDLIISGGEAKKGSSYTCTIQVPTAQQETKALPYVIKEVRTGDKVLPLKNSNSNANDENYYSFSRNNDVAGQIYIHRVEGPVSVKVELNDKGKATRVQKVEVVSTRSVMLSGETIHLEAKVYPEYATNKSVSWKVLNEAGNALSSLASITRYGDLTAGLRSRGVVNVVAVSNDTHIASEPFQIKIESAVAAGAFDYRELEGSNNVEIYQNEDTQLETGTLDLTVVPSGKNIISLAPIYSHGRNVRNTKGAFEGCSMQKVILPDTIIEISKYCFADCKNLTEITIPKSVKAIGYGAFEGCTKLNKVTFEEGSQLQAIEDGAFYGCEALTNDIALPSTVDTIKEYAFIGSGLKNLTIEGSPKFISSKSETSGITLTAKILTDKTEGTKNYVKYDDNYNFVEATSDASYNDGTCNITEKYQSGITLKEGKLVIPSHVFDSYGDCAKVAAIESHGFSGDQTIKSVEFPYGLKVINDNAFYNCQNLESVHLHSNIKKVLRWAFEDCYSLEEIVIDEGVEVLEMGAFNDYYGYTSVEKIVLPSSIKYIGQWCFYGMGVKEIIFKDNNYDWYRTWDISYSTGLNDLDLDGDGNFSYFNFEDDDKGEVNAKTLASDNIRNKGYSDYAFNKNYVHTFKYMDIDDYVGGLRKMKKSVTNVYTTQYNFNYYGNGNGAVLSIGGTPCEPIKTGVTYCYKFDFNDNETKDISLLKFGIQSSGLYDSRSYSNLNILSLQICDENGPIDENSEYSSKEFIAKSNKYGYIDLTLLKEKYEKLYLYIKYDAEYTNGDNVIHGEPLAPGDSAVSNVATGTTKVDVTSTGTTYNFTPYVYTEGEVINSDLNTMHFYGNQYRTDATAITSAGTTISYVYDFAELGERGRYDWHCSSIPIYITNLYSGEYYSGVTKVNVTYLEEGGTKPTPVKFSADPYYLRYGTFYINGSGTWTSWEEVPIDGKLTITITYGTPTASNEQVYLLFNLTNYH